MHYKFSRVPRVFLIWVAALGVWFSSTLAFAAGRVEWKSREFKEREGGSWRLELAIFLTRPPSVAHVPMKFEFEPTVYYERDMMDGDKLVERKVPLQGRPPIIETADVGFLDNNSGKIETRTRFTFKLTRAHGFEAGQYKVTVRDGTNGQAVGTPTELSLAGENEIIDRRAMVFTGEKKKKKKDEGAEAKGEAKPEATDEGSKQESEKPAGGSEATEPAEDKTVKEPAPAAVEAERIKEKPGGCGCRTVGGTAGQDGWGGVPVLVMGLVLLGRRRAGC